MSFLRKHRLHLSPRLRVAAVCALLLAVGAHELTHAVSLNDFRYDVHHAFAPPLSGTGTPVSFSFPFQQTWCRVTVEVDDGELAASRAVAADQVFDSSGSTRQRLIKAVVQEQARSKLVERLVTQFRAIRDQRQLDSDEYLELLTAAVQSIPYDDGRYGTLLAPELLVAGSGICTDKTLLLASLLVHEQYDTVIWILPTQHHAAVGVASDRAQFKGSGYAFIETTQPGFVGQASEDYLAPGPMIQPPVQIALGGWRRYEAGDQIEAILSALESAQDSITFQGSYSGNVRTAADRREVYAERQVETWVAEGMVRFIMTGTHDREGVYAVVAHLSEQ